MSKPKRITPITKAIEPWVEMTYDAMYVVAGIRWLRVKDSMGGRGDREDWVADFPGVCLSVHDYHWQGTFGPQLGTTCEEVMRRVIQQSVVNLEKEIARLQRELLTKEDALVRLKIAAELTES